MDLQEITSLISIRAEVARIFNLQSEDLKVPREKIFFLQEMEKKLDKKIGALLLGSDFQDYLDGKQSSNQKELQKHSNDSDLKGKTWGDHYREMGAHVFTTMQSNPRDPLTPIVKEMAVLPGRTTAFEVPGGQIPLVFAGTNQTK